MAYRRGRINEEMVHALTEILRTVKDPRVSGSFISITTVDCAADLYSAKVYYSVYGSDEDQVREGLEKASGYIRSQLAQRLNMRHTPELRFIKDNSIEYGAHINDVLKKIIPEKPENEEESEEDDDQE
ncbi:MAG: 30S ribosome-binding factor RbfA [Clostridia bacterium]|nr:30S ribosome-binding factor RbfA [Clostridia bacterium]